MIVVGGGHAGAELALQLREQGWTGGISLYSDESRPPYHRPPLSKAFMAGTVAAEQLMIRPQAAYDKAQVVFHGGIRVATLNPLEHRITLADGSSHEFAGLALTTGARARRLTLPGLDPARAHPDCQVLRTLEDAQAIRARCVPGARLVIVGAGYIGLELAASARALDVQVSVIEQQPRVLARVAGAPMADFLAAAHRAAGVDLHLGTHVTGVIIDPASGRLAAVHCSDGSTLDLDLLVMGVGVEPNVDLAQAAGLAVDNGIVVDECARTSAQDIVAAGDCTAHPSALYGVRVRLESVPNALEQARTAAATLVGKERPYRQAPWFWSDQFDLRIKSVGLLSGHDRCVVRGDPATRSFAVFYLQGARILAVDTVNRMPEFQLAKRIVAEDLRIPASALGDESVALKDLLPPMTAA
jgi:3-phenylpropionate/trans-cinnamate dioxygenase ferredoxin reductase subunit